MDRPICDYKRESIDAHLTFVLPPWPISHYVEAQIGWGITKFVRTARRYGTVQIEAGRGS